jgi:hypothetical protein
MSKKEELVKQMLELQKQLDAVEHDYAVGDEVYTCTGICEVKNLFYDEQGVEFIQVLMKQLDAKTEKELTGSETLCTMPISHFKKRVSLYHAGQDAREQLKQRGIQL